MQAVPPRRRREKGQLMRLWLQSRAVRATLAGASLVSIAFHAATISTWVIATLPQPNVESGSIANHVFYIPPPDRMPSVNGLGERVTYIKLVPAGGGLGDVLRAATEVPSAAEADAGRHTSSVQDTVATSPEPPSTGNDSVYSVLDVDTAAVRSASSAAPAYPLTMLEQHAQGFVNALYVVDTTGFADTTTFVVLEATRPEFVGAVREALPYMRFRPAKIRQTKVRQLVQQRFSFQIADTGKVIAKAKKD
jgi:hypothetical protein